MQSCVSQCGSGCSFATKAINHHICSLEITLLGCYFLVLILPKGRHKTTLEIVQGIFFSSNILSKRNKFLGDLVTRYFFILPFVYRR
jgi:hypothetical protein